MSKLPPLAGKADDLEAIRDAVVSSAGVGAGLWFSYLFVLFYFLVAAGGVTHLDLLYENPVKLPFLNVDLPLKGFFWLGPLLFVIVHAYVLLHLNIFALKVGAFHAALKSQITDDLMNQVGDTHLRNKIRLQLPSNIFVQFYEGPREVRMGPINALLQVIVWISLVIGPIALLVFFQLQFLAYHDAEITWFQRILVVIDLILLFRFWLPTIRGELNSGGLGKIKPSTVIVMTLTALASLFFAFIIATFPGESLDAFANKLPITPVRDYLIAGETDLIERKPDSIWSNRLVLPGLDVIDHAKFDTEEKIAALPTTISLRGRDLRGAVLIGANLRNADFTGADLQDARLEFVDLRGATLKCENKSPDGTRDDLYSGEGCVKLQNASLSVANLQGVSLDGAQLQGAKLWFTQLGGASLEKAQLQGARLFGTELMAASLNGAHLERAILVSVALQGASLEDAQFQAASLSVVNLQGASLRGANLEGALLDNLQLQGVDLKNVNLRYASLRKPFVWRTDVRKIHAEGAMIDQPVTGKEYECGIPLAYHYLTCRWSDKVFNDLIRLLEEKVADGYGRIEALERIERLNPSIDMEDETETKESWDSLGNSILTIDEYEQGLAKLWIEIGCAGGEGAPQILEELIDLAAFGDSRFDEKGQQLSKLADDFLDKIRIDKLYYYEFRRDRRDHCPGVRGLSEAAIAKLEGLRSPPK